MTYPTDAEIATISLPEGGILAIELSYYAPNQTAPDSLAIQEALAIAEECALKEVVDPLSESIKAETCVGYTEYVETRGMESKGVEITLTAIFMVPGLELSVGELIGHAADILHGNVIMAIWQLLDPEDHSQYMGSADENEGEDEGEPEEVSYYPLRASDIEGQDYFLN